MIRDRWPAPSSSSSSDCRSACLAKVRRETGIATGAVGLISDPQQAENILAEGKADFIGVGRMVLAYPDLPADVLAGRPLARKRLCRTFSDCTTAPRNGMVSGCYPLDPFYKARPEREAVSAIKSQWKDDHAR